MNSQPESSKQSYSQWSFADALGILKDSVAEQSTSTSDTPASDISVEQLLGMIRSTIPPLMWQESDPGDIERFLRQRIGAIVRTARSFGISSRKESAEANRLTDYWAKSIPNFSSISCESSIRLRAKWLIAAAALGLMEKSDAIGTSAFDASNQVMGAWSRPSLFGGESDEGKEGSTVQKRPLTPMLGTLAAAEEVIKSLGPRDDNGNPMVEAVEIKELAEPIEKQRRDKLHEFRLGGEVADDRDKPNVFESMLGPYGISTSVQPVLGGNVTSLATHVVVKCKLREDRQKLPDDDAPKPTPNQLTEDWIRFRNELKNHWADRLFPAWVHVEWRFEIPWKEVCTLDSQDFHLNESFTLSGKNEKR